MDLAVADLNRKIEALTAQVAYLSEQAQLTERQRQDRAELMRDLTPVAEEALRLSVEQLEEIQDYIDLSDLLATVAPLADEAFAKAVDILAEMERKGYFGLSRTGMRSLDQMVTSLTKEEVRHLGEGASSCSVPSRRYPNRRRFAFLETSCWTRGARSRGPLTSRTLASCGS